MSWPAVFRRLVALHLALAAMVAMAGIGRVRAGSGGKGRRRIKKPVFRLRGGILPKDFGKTEMMRDVDGTTDLEDYFPPPIGEYKQYKEWVTRHNEMQYRAYKDAIHFDKRYDLLPKPFNRGEKWIEHDPYATDDEDPPEPGSWRKSDRNKTLHGYTHEQLEDLQNYMRDMRESKALPDFLPLEGYNEAKRALIDAMEHQDPQELEAAIDGAYQFQGLLGYTMEAEVLLNQIREKEAYDRYKIKRGFMRSRIISLHINDRQGLLLARERKCKELTITVPEPQYQICNMSDGEPTEQWLDLAGCEDTGHDYCVFFANNSVNRAMGFAGMMLQHVQYGYVRKKPMPLPPELYDIYSLKRLKIKSNGVLQGLTEDLGKLRNLKELDLSHNALKSLPNSIGNLKKLEILDISHNDIERLPLSIRELNKNLRVLHAPHNKLTHFSDVLALCSLVHLNLDHNELKGEVPFHYQIASSFESLTLLSFAHNKLERILPGLALMPSLKYINASSNNLRRLPLDWAQFDYSRILEIKLHCNNLIDQPRIDRLLMLESPTKALVLYMQHKAFRKVHGAQSRYIYILEDKDLKALIDRIGLTEDLDIHMEHKLRALHYAAALNEYKLTEALLQQGAEPMVEDDHGNTPLHYAMAHEHMQVVEILVNAGADVNKTNKYGQQPMDLAKLAFNQFVAPDSDGEEGDGEPEYPTDENGNIFSGFNRITETSARVCVGRLLGVPPVPMLYPSETERMLNISHVKCSPLPLTRPLPGSPIDDDFTTGECWNWIAENVFNLLRLEVEDPPEFGAWLKQQVRRIQDLLRKGDMETLQEESRGPEPYYREGDDDITETEGDEYKMLDDDGKNDVKGSLYTIPLLPGEREIKYDVYKLPKPKPAFQKDHETRKDDPNPVPINY